MAKKDNIFVRAKAYVKDHPRTSFQDAIKKVAKHKVAGPKKVSGTRKVSGPKTVVAGTRPRKKVGSTRVASTKIGSGLTRVERAKELIKDIAKLERERARVNNKELRDIYALEINAHHKRLKGLHK